MAVIDYDKQLGKVTDATRKRAHEIIGMCQRKGISIKQLWGYNPNSKPEHSSGRAIDFMVYKDKAAGNAIAEYLIANHERLGVKWLIWYQRIYSFTPGKPRGWQNMPDRGNATTNHKDHVHVFFDESEYQAPENLNPLGKGLKPFSWPAFVKSMRGGEPTSHVRIVRNALIRWEREEGLAPTKGLSNAAGKWRATDKAAYSRFQKSFGFTGNDADGIPGPATLRPLLKSIGFALMGDK